MTPSSHVTIIAGLPIPSDATLFLAGMAVHVAAGLLCVAG
jgi:membrane protein DedA with SNARE-associated domain